MQDQCQHWQFRRHLERRRRAEEASHRGSLRSGHRNGSFHRGRHSHNSRSDHPALAGSDWHGANLRSDLKSEACRRSRQKRDVGSYRRASAARCGLYDHPRRCSHSICAHGFEAYHGHSQPRRRDPSSMDDTSSQTKLPLRMLRRHLQNLRQVRRKLFARRWPASRLLGRCQR